MNNVSSANQHLEKSIWFRRASQLVLSFIASLFVTAVMAHQTFMLPTEFNWKVGDKIDVMISSALSFPDLNSGLKIDRIASVSASIDGVDAGPVSYEEGKEALRVRFIASRKGTAILTISSKPRHGAIAIEKTDAYFEEIGAEESIVRAFHKASKGEQLQRSYSKHVKALMCIEDCSTNAKSNFVPVGQVLEFVGVINKPRDYVLLRNGKPLVNHPVTMVAVDKSSYKAVTDSNGIVSLNSRLSGAVIITAVVITMPEKVTGVYHSDYATLTLDLGSIQE